MARFWQLRNELWQLPEEGALMGILNVTPDSFSDGGQHNEPDAAHAHAQRLIAEGADLIDIGGESTRPGGSPVRAEEEQSRVLPVIRALRAAFPTLRLSIDTRHPETARLALDAGADIINDVTGLTNPAMRALCAAHPCGIVIMHQGGDFLHAPLASHGDELVADVRAFFESQVRAAEAAGISPARLCLDPGIGFGKNTAQNLTLINHLEALRVRGLPLLMALSRKRFLGEVCGDPLLARTSAQPTLAMSLRAAANGADLHRVHDIAPHRAALHARPCCPCPPTLEQLYPPRA